MGEPGWQAVPGTGAPVEVAAARARGIERGLGVGDAVFASPTTGWAYAGDLETAQCRVLFTGDAGATWTPQLAWHGLIHARIAAFGERAAGLVLAVSQGEDINGYRAEPRAPGDPYVGPDTFLAGTQDAGATWTLTPIPDRQASGPQLLTPRQMRLKLWVSNLVRGDDGSYSRREGGDRSDLMRSQDGGVTWQRAAGLDGVGVMTMRFQSPDEGLLVATGKRNHVDVLYRTADGGITWERVPLALPPGLPASAETLLDPVARPDGKLLLLLSVRSRSDSERRPKWEGSYAYQHDRGERGWDGPHRLPLPTARLSPPHLAMPGPDGRAWAAAGRDLYVADDLAGPWQHRQMPLPDGQCITRLDPVADGVLWFTTRPFPAVGRVSGGQLYRSPDDGAHWVRVAVGADCSS